MMIVVSRRYPLPVGEVYRPPVRRGRAMQRQIVLQHPVHGEYRGPFFVIREVTLDEYCDWYAREYGQAVTPVERCHTLHPAKWICYDVSLD